MLVRPVLAPPSHPFSSTATLVMPRSFEVRSRQFVPAATDDNYVISAPGRATPTANSRDGGARALPG
jgi:hypothetical protein